MSPFRQGNARHMAKDEVRSRHTGAGASSSRLDTDVAVPASIGGEAVTRLSLRSASAPAGGGSTPSSSEVMPQRWSRNGDPHLAKLNPAALRYHPNKSVYELQSIEIVGG